MTSRTIYKRLWAALGLEPVDLHATLAQIAVLYEDLRLELTGFEKQFPDLQAIGENYRRNYFVRRSIATLLEFSVALKMLDENPDWQLVKERFGLEPTAMWAAAMKYFKENHSYLKKIRDDFGGHFGFKAAKWAVQNLSKDAHGSIEIYGKPTENKAGPKMHFASEFVSTAMCRHKPSQLAVNSPALLPQRPDPLAWTRLSFRRSRPRSTGGPQSSSLHALRIRDSQVPATDRNSCDDIPDG